MFAANTPSRSLGMILVAFAIALAATGTSLGLLAPAASALPCRTCDGGGGPPDPPDPPTVTPVLTVELVRQTPDRGSVQVAGWTAQSTAPTTPLTVLISVDGGSATSVTANIARSDVAAKYPKYGPNHGYDVTVPASAAAHTVCITAVHVGDGVDTTACRNVDSVVSFIASGINYDLSRLQITSTNVDEVDSAEGDNYATVTEPGPTMSGQVTFTDTSGWQDTYGVQVTATAGINIPIFASFTVQLQGSKQWQQNGSTSNARSFGWSQPLTVPPESIVKGKVVIYHTTLIVPYSMPGNAVYASGATAPYAIQGTYTGVTSHDIQSVITQYNLDGTPVAPSVRQPAAKFSESVAG